MTVFLFFSDKKYTFVIMFKRLIHMKKDYSVYVILSATELKMGKIIQCH